MLPFVVKGDTRRFMTEIRLDSLLRKVTVLSQTHKDIVVDLSGLNLRFDHLSRVTKYFRDTRTRVFALDMSMNRIQADWTSLTPILHTLFGEQLVQYLDLGMNYLPPLSSLKALPAEKQTFRKFGQQLSLGLDCVSYSGDPDLDYWTENARTFKTVAYGLTEFVDDAAEV